MRKIVLMLSLIMTMMLPVSLQAASTRSIGIVPRLSFAGTTANCSVIVTANSSEDDIELTVKLWRGSTCLETWNDSGSGYLTFKETANVTQGQTYSMTVDVIINGVAQESETISGTCE